MESSMTYSSILCQLPPSESDQGSLLLCSPPSPCLQETCSAIPSKHGRTWDGEARARHSERCTGRSRLTLSEKTDIIKLYYEPSSSRPPVDQKTLARMYGKSKAAISKILKPEYAHRVLSSYAKVVGVKEMNLKYAQLVK
ncbi:hypothetical protein GUITHDRAFT_114294 [Guillardia theta CCMP2712]|uniref:Uncharacterized protein n=1 Tax=Guillardia theta (strain CCMP2712) TaxID=905079 RepID=L1ITK6_GUITC|nr:hypothetical protein GUITHDRAFT_114294 [Guillardia theta CCMP2712]EKX39568.1 hypothetical protein GUITHDRAFT_114294 [Guillardia theta CCMP2712]|eukprot:XP_005826548.1 hypothetical protein GUITHDRAFT_114294 [Guillardia theta CCMP2712]